jgi:orotidine-5'-phosphate decarboxylase
VNEEPGPAARERVIVALDVPDLGALEDYLDRLEGQPVFYKVGLELFVSAGARAIEAVRARGGKVFLDLKLHDIPETVGRAVEAAARLDVELVTVHVAGGAEMVRRAVEAAGERPRILGVTVLTSLAEEDLAADGLAGPVSAAVGRRARLAAAAGVAGLVCSPHEIAEVKAAAGAGRKLLAVVPGVRPAGASPGDQKRVATPAAAIARGADYLVVGRPLREAAHPAEAFAALAREVDAALPVPGPPQAR